MRKKISTTVRLFPEDMDSFRVLAKQLGITQADLLVMGIRCVASKGIVKLREEVKLEKSQ